MFCQMVGLTTLQVDDCGLLRLYDADMITLLFTDFTIYTNGEPDAATDGWLRSAAPSRL